MNLKNIICLICLCFAFSSVQAQEVDEILKNYFESMGGLEKIKEMKSTKMEGIMSMGPMEFPGVITAMEPNLQRVDVNVQGKEIVQAYDGETAWMVNPFQGGEAAQKMPEEMAEEMVNDEFQDSFIDYKDKGHKVELLGREEVEGAETYKIKLTKKNGDIEYYYFDTEYYIPIMTKSTVKSGPGKGQEVETYLSDYQEVDGIMMPFYIETKTGGETMQKITIKEVVLNPEIEEGFFDFPAASEEDKEEMKGEKAEEPEVEPSAPETPKAGEAKPASQPTSQPKSKGGDNR